MTDFITYTSSNGKSESIATDLIARTVAGSSDGCVLLLRDGQKIQTQDSNATIQARLDALRNASSQLIITDGITAPGTTSGVAIIYVDSADGDLKVKYSDGTTKVIVADT